MKSNKTSTDKLIRLFDKELKSKLLSELKNVRIGKASAVQTSGI